MTESDLFGDLARYYDGLMAHVNYDRWLFIATELASMIEPPFRHLDAACGTGVLLHELHKIGWTSFGNDISRCMLKAGQKKRSLPPVVNADLRAMPFAEAFNYVTCLFDSVNFLMTLPEMQRAFRELASTMKPDGLLYFDFITERMVTDFFANQDWEENAGEFRARWQSRYNPKTRVSETDVRINNGPLHSVAERVYANESVFKAVEEAGFTILGAWDAEGWRPIRKRTLRVDVVAVKGKAKAFETPLEEIRRNIQAFTG